MTTIKMIKGNVDKIQISFVENGVVEVRVPRYFIGAASQGERGRTYEKISDIFMKMLASTPDGTYLRCTNNKSEQKLLRAGQLRNSKNYADGTSEKGISVSAFYGYADAYGYKYCYIVRGTVIGIGSDGEPVLDAGTIEILSPMMDARTANQKRRDRAAEAVREFCEGYGWTPENVQDCTQIAPYAGRIAWEDADA